MLALDLEKFILDIEQEHSPHVAGMCLKIAKAAINYAMKHKLVKENNFSKIKVKVPKKPKFHLTEEQARHVLKCCSEIYPRHYDLFYTMLGSGMREGEAFALNKGAIDIENKRILIDKQFTKGPCAIGIDQAKLGNCKLVNYHLLVSHIGGRANQQIVTIRQNMQEMFSVGSAEHEFPILVDSLER